MTEVTATELLAGELAGGGGGAGGGASEAETLDAMLEQARLTDDQVTIM